MQTSVTEVEFRTGYILYNVYSAFTVDYMYSTSIVVTFKGEELATGNFISVKDGTCYISDCANYYVMHIGIYSLVSFGKFLIDLPEENYSDIELPDIVPPSSATGRRSKTSFAELEVNTHFALYVYMYMYYSGAQWHSLALPIYIVEIFYFMP